MAVVLDKMFAQTRIEKGSFDDDERSFIAWASRPVLDRDHEIIAHDAWDLENYEKNKVLLWAHDYTRPPIGKVLWLKPQKNGLKFKPQFADTAMAKEIYELYKDGFMSTFSVGFIPNEWNDDDEQAKDGEAFNRPLRTYTDVELLEISCVPVPSCPDAVAERYANGEIRTKGLKTAIEHSVSKTVIPFKKHSLAPEDTAWNGPAERSAAEVSDLKLMSTWYDSENADVKGSYKLPHHKASGHSTVWRGVAAAMVALLGGRGGVAIPSGDKKGVYNHLAKHYKEFDKPVPEFKEYEDAELKALFNEEELREQVEDTETIETSAGDVAGGWEPVEIEERDPIEAMRREGLEKAEDGFIPVSVSMWNEMCSTVKVASAKSDAYLQQVYGGITPPDGKWNKSLSDAFDLPVLEDVTSSFKYTLYADYLSCEIKNIYMNSYEIPSPLLGSYMDAIQRLTADFTVHDIRRFSSKGEETPPITDKIQLTRDEYGEYLVSGTKFCEADGYNIILNFSASWYGLDFSVITSAEKADANREILNGIHKDASGNVMMKGEKFSLSGEFLDPTDEVWDDVVIPDEDKTAIRKSMSVLEDGKSRGLLMVGPPGTGKTMTGRIMMNVTESTYIWVSSRDFGYSASSRIINLAFNMARRLAPTILFMEDIDGWLGGGSTDAMKTEMDGIRATKGVMSVLTTNFPQRLPKALIDRPGRFHHVILFDLPDVKQRHQMLATWTDGVDKETLIDIAKKTEGFSGAHIRELVDYAEFISDEEGIPTGKALVRSMEKLQEQRELVASFDTEKGPAPDMIEYTDEDFDLMVQQELKIKKQAEAIKSLRHDIAVLNAKMRVALGGTG